MKMIPLTQGKQAIVDDEDFEELNKWKWYINKHGYAMHTLSIKLQIKGKNKNVFMHRLITKVEDGYFVDHINGNPLDNRKENLRICNHGENIRNQKKRKDNTSGYKGVAFSKLHKKWGVHINVNNKRHFLGLFLSKEDAALTYDIAARKYHGEFARLNFPRPRLITIEIT